MVAGNKAMNMGIGQRSTIGEYISDYQSEQIKINSFFLKEVFKPTNGNMMLVNFENILTKYYPEFEIIKRRIELNNEEQVKYRCNPKLMSYDLYGTTELWFLILQANELKSSLDLVGDTVYLYDPSIVSKVRSIINLSKTQINNNFEYYMKELL